MILIKIQIAVLKETGGNWELENSYEKINKDNPAIYFFILKIMF